MSTPFTPTKTPSSILDLIFEKSLENLQNPFVADIEISSKVQFVCRCSNQSGTRFLMACLIAKLSDDTLDIRKPYTEIGGEGKYSGRHYDETYIAPFVFKYKLPVNPTTSFLTPAFRTNKTIIEPGVDLIGRPKQLYKNVIELITYVYQEEVSAENLLAEIIRWLLIIREERHQRITSLVASLSTIKGDSTLPAESIVNLITQHLSLPKSSRLPVLIVTAAYQAAQIYLGEKTLPLQSHNAADSQTGSFGDVEITLKDDNNIITVYEMKAKRVTNEDIEIALQKLAVSNHNIDNYIFITTEKIDSNVQEYATTLYTRIGIEFVILDCIGFIRHFLHFFYRIRMQFLEAYQTLVMNDADSAVNPSLKEAFLALRLATETGLTQSLET